MPKKKHPDVQNTSIPPAFYKAGKGLMVHTVGELKAILEMLPDDLSTAYSEEGALLVTVSNNGVDAPTEPYVVFEEIDDEEEYDGEF